MEQHPVPQHVSSYQFKLVGDMTLKQFFQLGGGALVSLIFYASSLNPLIKWPLVIFFALLGVGLAFLPFQDRPLEKWILAFFKSVYSPTLFYWTKTKVAPDYYQPEGGFIPETPEKTISPEKNAALNTYLSQTPQQNLSYFTKLEASEKSFLGKTLELFGAGELKISSKVPPPPPPPPVYYQGVSSQTPISPKPEVPIAKPGNASLFSVTPTPGMPTGGIEAQFSQTAATPTPPTSPNLISGQVIDALGRIVEGAIMEVRDSVGQPVRALKTNKLGHFLTVTPLINGRYQIITEKEGEVFDPISFQASGEIIPPIAIKAKGAPN